MFKIRSLLTIAAVVVLVTAVQTSSGANLVVNPGFETLEPIGNGLPNSYGDWNGNRSAIVVAENGVTPRTGARMLRFDGTATSGDGAGSSIGGNVYQIVDVSQWAAQIATGRVVVSASAFFNRVNGDGQTDTQFTIDIFAYPGLPANFPSQALSAYLIRQTNCLLSDGDPGTWQQLSTQAVLPSGTTYIAISVSAVENVFNDLGPPEFDGHYAEDVNVEVDAPCIGDTNSSHTVDVIDLLNVINGWGACP